MSVTIGYGPPASTPVLSGIDRYYDQSSGVTYFAVNATTWQAQPPVVDWKAMLSLNGAVPSSPLSLPSDATAPSIDAITGANLPLYGAWGFQPAADQSVSGRLDIPAAAPANLVLELRWFCADTNPAHTVCWQWDYLAQADGADLPLIPAGSATVNVAGTTAWQTSTIKLTAPACNPGDTFFFRVTHEGTAATVTSPVELVSVRIHS